MSLWNFWKRLRDRPEEDGEEEAEKDSGPIRLPTEPFVFECRQCGKIFEARKKHPTCPECDSDDVEAMG